MLIQTDIRLPAIGAYTCAGNSRTLDAREAVEAMARGLAVFPADADTAEFVASRIHATGNDTRAEMVRRWARRSFGDSAEPVVVGPAPESPSASTAGVGDVESSSPAASELDRVHDAAAAAKVLVDDAGDDPSKLLALSLRAGVELKGEMTGAKARAAILKAIAKNVAAGQMPLREG